MVVGVIGGMYWWVGVMIFCKYVYGGVYTSTTSTFK
jgi:hypothetical protein